MPLSHIHIPVQPVEGYNQLIRHFSVAALKRGASRSHLYHQINQLLTISYAFGMHDGSNMVPVALTDRTSHSIRAPLLIGRLPNSNTSLQIAVFRHPLEPAFSLALYEENADIFHVIPQSFEIFCQAQYGPVTIQPDVEPTDGKPSVLIVQLSGKTIASDEPIEIFGASIPSSLPDVVKEAIQTYRSEFRADIASVVAHAFDQRPLTFDPLLAQRGGTHDYIWCHSDAYQKGTVPPAEIVRLNGIAAAAWLKAASEGLTQPRQLLLFGGCVMNNGNISDIRGLHQGADSAEIKAVKDRIAQIVTQRLALAYERDPTTLRFILNSHPLDDISRAYLSKTSVDTLSAHQRVEALINLRG